MAASPYELRFEMLLLSMNSALTRGYQREVRFDPKRKWRFDFAWPKSLVAVEIHGMASFATGHRVGNAHEKDYEKMNMAQLQGWLVLQFSGRQVMNESAECLDLLRKALALRSSPQ